VTFSKIWTFGLLAALLLVPLVSGASDCFKGVDLGETTVFQVAGVNYSNCFLEILQDSTGLWLTSVELEKMGTGHLQKFRETVSDLDNHPYCAALKEGGMAGIPALKETVRVKTQVEGYIRNALAELNSQQAFELGKAELLNATMVREFGVELKWEKRLSQAFYKILPSENWKSAESRHLIVSRLDWEHSSGVPWCDVWDSLDSQLRWEGPDQLSVVYWTGSQFRRRVGSDWSALGIGFEKSQ